MRWFALLCMFASGCAFHVRAPPPGPPPSSRAPLSRAQVVGVAMNYAAIRGYQCRVKEMEREHEHWKVNLAVAAPLKGKVKMKIDGWTGEIIKVHEDVEERGHHHGHHGDHDED